MKNQDIEQAVFEEFLKVSQLKIENLSPFDQPRLTFQFGERKVGVELTDLFGPERSIDKIRTTLRKKIEKDHAFPGHETWLLLYANHEPVDDKENLSEEMPQIERLVAEFLSIKKEIARVIIFDMASKQIPLEMIRS